jgi:small conductance mechanosensitive channel
MDGFAGAFDMVKAKVGEWHAGFFYILPNLIVSFLAGLVFLALAFALSRIMRRALLRAQRRDLAALVSSFVFWLIILFGALVVLTILLPSMKPVDIFASLGIGSIAVGFAFKDILQNWLAGFLILIRRPFRRGDQIKLGDVEGTVQAVETRATLVRTYDGRLVVIPNSDVYTQALTVNTAYDMRRTDIVVPVGLEVDLDQVIAVIKQAVASVPDVLPKPMPDVLPWEFKDLNVNLIVRWWTKPQRAHVVRTRSEIVKAIKKACEAAGIALPSDTRVAVFRTEPFKLGSEAARSTDYQPDGDAHKRTRPKEDDPETAVPKPGGLDRGRSDVPR